MTASPIFACSTKVESKLLKFTQKGPQSKKQKICELSKLSKKKRNNAANSNEDKGLVEVLVSVDMEITIPGNDTDSEQVLLAVPWVSDAERHFFQLFPEVMLWDTTQKKREKRLLFLACGKDGNNSSFKYLPGHLCQVNPSGFSISCMARQYQLY
jgi:hypothetical protein